MRRALAACATAGCALLLALVLPAFADGQWTGGSYTSWKGFLFYAPMVWPSRDYKLYVPAGLPKDEPAPLVVMLHGCKQDPDAFAAGTRMNQLADRHGFRVLYPRQGALQNVEHCWNWFDAASQRGWGEAAIIAGMVEDVAKRNPVDRHRIYVAGLSAGGAMTSILASCRADLFAAAAVHSGVAYEAATNPWTALAALEDGGSTPPDEAGRDAWKCSGSAARAMPVIVFQGESDTRVRPVNAGRIVGAFAQMNDLADDGKDNDSVKAQPTSARAETVSGQRAYLVREYAYGGKTLIREYRVEGMGHAWSGGDEAQPYNDRLGPDASALIWEFFSQHTR
ncbi:MAG TPA: PHB depolymerase family esterase [Burkholderiales bacterium]|nr:PHB depolymerase family esterase [Burkholderiales bacterium]